MSNRRTTSPQTALSDVLVRAEEDIDQLRSRSRWPGAIKQDLQLGPTTCLSRPGLTASGVPGFAYPYFTTIASIRVEAGGWMLKAGAAVQMSGVARVETESLAVMRLVSNVEDDPLRVTARQMPGSYLPEPISITSQLLLGAHLVAETAAEVYLQVGQAYVGPTNPGFTCSASAIHLIAVPT